jgi:hypothetical protein
MILQVIVLTRVWRFPEIPKSGSLVRGAQDSDGQSAALTISLGATAMASDEIELVEEVIRDVFESI